MAINSSDTLLGNMVSHKKPLNNHDKHCVFGDQCVDKNKMQIENNSEKQDSLRKTG